jgi:hypothetical protein
MSRRNSIFRPEAGLSTYTIRMDVNCAIDDLIDNPEPLEPNLPRSKVLYHKFFY